MKTPNIKKEYRILKKLDAGGMGVVYKAQKLATQEVVALKILPPKFAKEEERLTRFKREILACSRLDHPNLIRIMDSGCEDDLHFFTMEFFAGLSLKKMLKRDGPFDTKRLVDVAIKMTKGCSYAHQKSLIHRDLKPDNILLNDEGDLKIIDFGLAKIRDITTVTRTDQALGTTRYLAPEIILGKPIDARADIYQLGLIFYELLTGKQVFSGKTPMALLRSYVYAGKPIESFGFQIDDENWNNLIRNCIAIKPENRYANARVLLEDLTTIQQGGNISRLSERDPAGTGKRPEQKSDRSSGGLKAASLKKGKKIHRPKTAITKLPKESTFHKILPLLVVGVIGCLAIFVFSLRETRISDVEISTSGNSATINWTTSRKLPSSVNYSPANIGNFKNIADSTEKGNHSLTISNLEPGQRYRFHFLLPGGKKSKQYVFQTSTVEFSNVWFISRNNGTTILSFSTSKPTICSVTYPSKAGMETTKKTGPQKKHSFTLENLYRSKSEKTYLDIEYQLKQNGRFLKERWHTSPGSESIITR